jgi:hypothetical protein
MAEKCTLFDTGFVVRTPGALLALIDAQVTEHIRIIRGVTSSTEASVV